MEKFEDWRDRAIHEVEAKAEAHFLKLANENGKFALSVGFLPNSLAFQEALERLQLKGWIKLIDISPLAYHDKALGGTNLYRIFLLSEEAKKWLMSYKMTYEKGNNEG